MAGMPDSGSTAPAWSIAAVERDTGLSKDTLRVWERRYGFPCPGRDARGERVYPRDQVTKLRVVKRLIDQGHRPGTIAARSVDDLQQLARAGRGPTAAPAQAPGDGTVDALLELVAAQRIDELQRELGALASGCGLGRFVIDVVAPLTERVGDAWAAGALAIAEEHLYTEAMHGAVRNAIGACPRAGTSPRALLTTVPQEPHGLGVLMAEAMLALAGARCVSLGVRTPIPDIVRAAERQRADIVALSFTAVVPPRAVAASLTDLRGQLPDAIELWAGGGNPSLRRRAPLGVRVVTRLADVAPAVARWRETRASA
jgi:DNA-binding transcriptional MerR regulator/methylmalonyl-CoA mutase cobalamin-binding subunit